MKKTEICIKKLIQAEPEMNGNLKLITSIHGIGNVDGRMTIAYTENFEFFVQMPGNTGPIVELFLMITNRVKVLKGKAGLAIWPIN